MSVPFSTRLGRLAQELSSNRFIYALGRIDFVPDIRKPRRELRHARCRTGSVTPVGCRSRRRVGLSRYLVGRCRLGSGLWLRVRHAGALGFLPAALHPRGHHGRGELLGHFGWGRGTRCRQWLAEFEAGPTSRAQNEPIGLYQRHEPRLTARTLRLYLFATHPSPINNPNWNGWPRGQRRTTSARSTTCSHPDTSPHKSWLRGRPERRTRAARRVRPV